MDLTEGSGGVVIRIHIHRLEPLMGTTVIDDGSPLGFEGWMELIGAVAKLLGSPDHVRSLDQQACAESGEKGVEP